MTAHLELDRIAKRFGDLLVLTDITLALETGERHALIGPNGAGKSTLFNIISGAFKPSSGTVLLEGQDVTGWSPNRLVRAGVGRSFQIINVFPELTVMNNVVSSVLSRERRNFHFLRPLDRCGEALDEAAEIIATVGLAEMRDVPATLLSHGSQRQLEIALTIALRPRLLLLDEPMAGLAKEEIGPIIELIMRVSEGRTLVMVEHDMEAVFQIADRISVLHHGTIIASGDPGSIRSDEKVKEAYLGKHTHAA